MEAIDELPKPNKKNPRFVLSVDLMKDAKDHTPRNRYVTDTELGRFMAEMGCTHKSNGQKWGWVFLPLTEARNAWRAQAGDNWDWLAPEVEDWGDKPSTSLR